MGNSVSSGRGHHEETVDFGYLSPQGIYTGPRDWNQTIVAQLICERRLAPFYRPLEDYEESWDDEQILAHRKEPPTEGDGAPAESSSSRADSASLASRSSAKRGHNNSNSKDIIRYPEAAIYRGAVECPICFLYYPPNINHSRCCDQAICTECFVQIKRADPDPKHLVSEPASCPYCVQENFGVVYKPPPWRTGLNSEGATPPSWPESPKQPDVASPMSAMKRPRKSFGADSPEVVTIDQIRPDWEAKLAAVRAAVARRANRRIIMRQVGDRLVPVGISSGRVHALPTEDGQIETVEGATDRGSRRARRRAQNQDFNQLLGNMGLGGQDLEELMVMEAMRLSLLEHEEQQRRTREEEEKKKAKSAAESVRAEGVESVGSSSAPVVPKASPSPPIESASASSTSVPTTSTESAVSSTNNEASAPPPTQSSNDQTLTSSVPTSRAAGTLDSIMDDANLISGPPSTPDVVPYGFETSPVSAGTTQDDEDGSGPQTPASAEPEGSAPSVVEPPASGTRAITFDRQDSLASSLAPSMGPSHYDMLSSSPESGVSSKPLLHSRPGTPSAPVVTVGAADSSATSTD